MTTGPNALRLSKGVRLMWLVRWRHNQGHAVTTTLFSRDAAVRVFLSRRSEALEGAKPPPRLYRVRVAAVDPEVPTDAEFDANLDDRIWRLGNDAEDCHNCPDAHGVEPASRDSLGEPVAGSLDT